VFGPQKGADEAMVKTLDKGLRTTAKLVRKQLGIDTAALEGAGAAGGMGAGMVAFFGAQLQMGVETVLDTVDFESQLQNANLVFTGEGRIDSQTLSGKVVAGVARRAKLQNVPVFAIVGDIGDDIQPLYSLGVTGIFSINRMAVDFAKAKPRSKNDLALTMDNLLRVLKAFNH
jgi:glycerate kinase